VNVPAIGFPGGFGIPQSGDEALPELPDKPDSGRESRSARSGARTNHSDLRESASRELSGEDIEAYNELQELQLQLEKWEAYLQGWQQRLEVEQRDMLAREDTAKFELGESVARARELELDLGKCRKAEHRLVRRLHKYKAILTESNSSDRASKYTQDCENRLNKAEAKCAENEIVLDMLRLCIERLRQHTIMLEERLGALGIPPPALPSLAVAMGVKHSNSFSQQSSASASSLLTSSSSSSSSTSSSPTTSSSSRVSSTRPSSRVLSSRSGRESLASPGSTSSRPRPELDARTSNTVSTHSRKPPATQESRAKIAAKPLSRDSISQRTVAHGPDDGERPNNRKIPSRDLRGKTGGIEKELIQPFDPVTGKSRGHHVSPSLFNRISASALHPELAAAAVSSSATEQTLLRAAGHVDQISSVVASSSSPPSTGRWRNSVVANSDDDAHEDDYLHSDSDESDDDDDEISSPASSQRNKTTRWRY